MSGWPQAPPVWDSWPSLPGALRSWGGALRCPLLLSWGHSSQGRRVWCRVRSLVGNSAPLSCGSWGRASPCQSWLRPPAHPLIHVPQTLSPGPVEGKDEPGCGDRPSPGPWGVSPGFLSAGHPAAHLDVRNWVLQPRAFYEISRLCLTSQVLQTYPRTRCPQHTVTWVSVCLSV